jgi:hypothetical protein
MNGKTEKRAGPDFLKRFSGKPVGFSVCRKASQIIGKK